MSFPIFCSADADFAALLCTAIDEEDESSDSPAGIVASTLPQSHLHKAAPNLKLASTSSTLAQSRQHRKRRRARDDRVLDVGHSLSVENARKHLKRSRTVKTGFITDKLRVAKGARTALNKPLPDNPTEFPKIEELLQAGFEYIPCGENGVPSKIERPILDSKGRVIALVAASPRDDTYDADAEELFDIIIEESDSDTFTFQELNHKRGDFPAINFGFTLPNGFDRPINLENSRHEEKIGRITGSRGFERICAFQDAAFSFWNPGVYEHQKSRVERLLKQHKDLKRTTTKTTFPTTACNFRNVCCYKHRDTQNCPYGWCAITALGRFDHTRGGHLILWELKLIIEFPHGYSILIPSATITHSNLPVVDGDVRVSITQYCAGSIFRYVDNGFRTDKDLKKEDKQRFDEIDASKKDMWKRALGLFSTMKDLKEKLCASE